MNNPVAVYQIYYDTRSARRLSPLYQRYLNERPTRFFEAAVIEKLIGEGRHRHASYFGVFSWQFGVKIPIGAPELLRRMERDEYAADVYTFFGRITDRHPWRLAEAKHPGITRAAEALFKRLEIDLDLENLAAPIVHQNHFICRSALYQRFVTDLLAPALRAMRDETDHELQELLAQDAGYQDPKLSSEQLREIFGRPHFCMHPFICERLFSTWLALSPSISVRHIWRGRFVAPENIHHEPEMQRGNISR